MPLYTWNTSYKNLIVKIDDITTKQITDFSSVVDEYCYEHCITNNSVTRQTHNGSDDYNPGSTTYGVHNGTKCACVGQGKYCPGATCPSNKK